MTDQDTIDKAAEVIAAHSTTAPPPHEYTEVCCGECGEAISWRGLTAEQTYERSRRHLAQALADAGLLADFESAPDLCGDLQASLLPVKLKHAEAERDAAVAKLDQIRDLHCVVTVHSIDDQGSITHVRECLACFVPYPCATVRILDGKAQS